MKPTSKSSNWLRQLKEEGHISQSKTLDEQPELFPDVVWIIDAFWWLSRRRQYGMNGPQPISPADLANYVELKRIRDGESIDELAHFISLLDDAWLTDWYKRADERNKTTSQSGKKY